MQYRRSHRVFCVAGIAAAFVAVVLTGCPTFEDGHTARYQQAELEELQDEAVALDLFRFGDRVRGVLRRYDISSSTARQAPFDEANEVRCRWTRVDEFDPETNRFSLTIPSSAEWGRVDLQGEIGEDGTLEVEIDEEEADQSREVRMLRTDRAPDSECRTIDDFLIRAIFDQQDNRLDPEVYEIQNPVFAILWVGLERAGRSLVEIEDPSPAFRFSQDRSAWTEDNGLDGNMSINVPAPSEQMLVESGDTRYALSHFVVVDDQQEEGGFSWNVGEEPIIATALERGVPDDAPEEVEQRSEQEGLELDRWGRALLFVEGRLDELDETFRREILIGLEEARPDRHFYIVDVFSYYEDQVEFIRLPPRPRADRPVQRRVPVQVTDEHIEANRVPVPRLYPSN